MASGALEPPNPDENLTWILAVYLYLVTAISTQSVGSSEHHCVWGSCQLWEYCCGENECCRENEYNYLLLTATVLGAVSIIVILCCYLYYSATRIYSPLLRKYLSINYVMMSKSNKDRESIGAECIVQVDQMKTNV